MQIKRLEILFILLLSIQPLKSQWTLEECISYAVSNNISIKQMELSHNRAEVNLHASKMALFPDISAGIGQTWNYGRTQTQSGLYQNQTQSNTSISLSSSLPLFTGGRLIHTIGKSKLDLQVSFYKLQKAQNDLALNVTSLFFEVLFQKELFKIAKERFATTSHQTALTELLTVNGKVPRRQLLDMMAQKANDTLSLVEASNSLTLALLDLAQALEITDAENFDIISPSELDEASIADSDDILLLSYLDIYERAVKNRPEIHSAEFELQSSEQSLKIAQSSYLPTISLQAGIGTNYFYLHNNAANLIFREQLKNNLSQYIGLNLNLPIFDRLSTFNSCRQAKLNIKNQQLALEHTRKQLFKEIQTAYLHLVASIEKRRTSRQLIVLAEEAFVYATEQYNSGKSSVFDFAQAQSQLVRAQSEEAKARYDYLFKMKVMEFYLR